MFVIKFEIKLSNLDQRGHGNHHSPFLLEMRLVKQLQNIFFENPDITNTASYCEGDQFRSSNI